MYKSWKSSSTIHSFDFCQLLDQHVQIVLACRLRRVGCGSGNWSDLWRDLKRKSTDIEYLFFSKVSAASVWDVYIQRQADYLEIARQVVQDYRAYIVRYIGEDSPDAAQYLTATTPEVFAQFIADALEAQKLLQ